MIRHEAERLDQMAPTRDVKVRLQRTAQRRGNQPRITRCPAREGGLGMHARQAAGAKNANHRAEQRARRRALGSHPRCVLWQRATADLKDLDQGAVGVGAGNPRQGMNSGDCHERVICLPRLRTQSRHGRTSQRG